MFCGLIKFKKKKLEEVERIVYFFKRKCGLESDNVCFF